MKNEKAANKVELLREALKKAGLDYIVTRTDGTIAHVNVWVGKD